MLYLGSQAPTERNQVSVSTAPIADYQTRLPRASQIVPGDFLDSIDANPDLRGVRNGRYRYPGSNVGSRVEAVAWVVSDGAGRRVEVPVEADGWTPARVVGFKITTRARTFTLPGNLADLTSAVVRRAS